MSNITKPIVLDENFTGFREQLKNIADDIHTMQIKMSPEFPLNSWQEFKTAIQHGYGPKLYPIGTEIQIGTDPLMVVVAHDVDKNPNDPTAHTCTLLAKKRIYTLQFDSAEAFYYCDEELPIGTYNFTLASAYSSWAAGTYQFTTTKVVPAGGQLCISGNAETALTSLKVRTFASQTDTAQLEDCTITSGNEGTALGTWNSTVMNHAQRISYGSNNYKESAIRQFLNSDGLAGEYWTPQTKFDRPPSWVASQRGFLGLISEDMVAAIGAVDIGCRTNTVYEAPDSTCGGTSKQYTLRDKVFLASMQNVGFASESVGEQTNIWDFYIGATDADRIKLNESGTAGGWWLRSPYPSGASGVRIVSTSGALDGSSALYSSGVVPACVIY